MKTIMWLMLIAALLPFFATISAKAGGKGFDNADPRLAPGWRVSRGGVLAPMRPKPIPLKPCPFSLRRCFSRCSLRRRSAMSRR